MAMMYWLSYNYSTDYVGDAIDFVTEVGNAIEY